ncbi:MAG: nucleotidyltransferase family protein [Gemmataceae bacterium]
MAMDLLPADFRLLDRIEQMMQKVRDRLLRCTAALEAAGVPYAVVGGNAVAAWVARVDESMVRNTRDVDILIRRSDLPAAKTALEAAGFVYRHATSIDMFLDGPGAKARDAVHVVFAGEKVRPEYVMPAPNVTEVEPEASYKILNLDALVCMKLTSFRDSDRTHLRDMIEAGMLNADWLQRLPIELAPRLKELLDNPEGLFANQPEA